MQGIGSITARSVIDRLIENPFRTLGLPADASLSRVEDACGTLRRAIKLNRTPETSWDLPWIGPVTRILPSVQSAMSQLVQPRGRLQARVWWFCEADVLNDSACFRSWHIVARSLSLRETSVAHHDAALAFLLACVIDDPYVNRSGWWGIALSAWDRLISSDAYWDYVMRSEAESGFEPPATMDDVHAVRSDAALVVANILTELAEEALQRGDGGCAARILELMAGAQATAHVLTPPLKDKVLQLDATIRGAWEAKLSNLCEDFQQQCLNNVHYENGFRDHNEKACRILTEQFESEIAPFLAQAVAILGEGTSAVRRTKESVAQCLRDLATAWTWADQWIQAQVLLERGMELIDRDSPVTLKIEAAMNNIKSAVDSERKKSSSSGVVPSQYADFLDLFLAGHELEIVDKRPAGGSLWVIGGKKLDSLMKELRELGVDFTFAEKGGRATGHRPAWYMRTSK